MGPFGLGFPADAANNGWRLYILSLVMIISAGLFVAARLTTRVLKSHVGWDDVAVVGSLLMSVLVSVFMQLAIENGYGMHKKDLTKTQLRRALQLFFFAQTPYKISVCLNKVSAILFCLRIFVSRRFRIAAFTVLGVIVAWSVGGVGATIWQCVPISGAWDKSVKATCIDSGSFWVAYAVMNVLTDVMVLVLPIPSVVRLQLHLRDKILLCGIFAMGGFVTITSVLRTTSVQNSLENKDDITFNFIQRGIWTLLEMNLGIISACLPALRKPFAKALAHVFRPRLGTSVGVGACTLHSHGADGVHLVDVGHSTSNKPRQSRHSDEVEIVSESRKDGNWDVDISLEQLPSGNKSSG